jgi:hypothetical protein
MADLPGGASGLLCRDYKGRNAARLVTRIDPGVVSLVAELRGHERRAVEELEQWMTRAEEAKPLDVAFRGWRGWTRHRRQGGIGMSQNATGGPCRRGPTAGSPALPVTCDTTAPAGAPVPPTAPAAPQGAAHRHAGWRGWPRPDRRGAATAHEPAALRRGSHDILRCPGTPQEPHVVPAGTSARGQLGRVGMGQRRSDRRAVPSRYAGRRRCNSRHRSPGYLLAGCGGRAVWRVGDNSLMWMGQRYGVSHSLSPTTLPDWLE